MNTRETPKTINFSADPIRRKIKKYNGKEIGFSIRNYAGGGWVTLWDGEEKTATHYA